MPSHVVNKLILDVSGDFPEKEANKASDALFDKRITPILEKVLEAYDGDDIVIDKPLELDLGELSESDLEYALENALSRALKQLSPEYHSVGPIRNHSLNVQTTGHQSHREASTLLDYIQYPVPPWTLEDISAFDLPPILKTSIRQITASGSYAKQFSEVIFDSLENCRRFFSLPFEKSDFSLLMERILLYAPIPNRSVYQNLIKHLNLDQTYNPLFTRQLLYYLLSCAKFGNHKDQNTSALVAALCLLNRDIFQSPNLFSKKNAKGSEMVTTDAEAFHTSKTFLAELTGQELRSKITRLIDVIEKSLQQTGYLEENITQIKSLVSDLWQDEQWMRYLVEMKHKGMNDVDSPEKLLKRIASGQLSMEDILYIAQTVESVQHHRNSLAEKLPESDKAESNAIRREAFSAENPTQPSQKQQGREEESPGIRELTRQIMKQQPELEERIPVYNAGLVLFQPFIISFFDRLGLLENRSSFKSEECQIRAAYLLHELTGATDEPLEHLMFLNKLLCGINILFPLGPNVVITEQEKQECQSLLKAVIHNWSIIRNTSVPGFQESFLRRNGMLERSDNNWILRVESKGLDILLDEIPWDIHLHSYPWNDYLIFVEWN